MLASSVRVELLDAGPEGRRARDRARRGPAALSVTLFLRIFVSSDLRRSRQRVQGEFCVLRGLCARLAFSASSA